MKIIQNFSSKKHVKDFPIIDILIGYVGLYKLRMFGHNVKLYCEKKDYDFLKEGGLLDLYTEIDDTFLSECKMINMVNGENFGSIRKIECINHEYEVSEEPFIYMDTDIIMNIPLMMMGDLLVGSPESQEKIYIPGKHLSKPYAYDLPDFINETEGAYNCGILGFKTKEQFEEYRKYYLEFVVNNPCITFGVHAGPETIRNIWACNAEQRILKAVATHNNGGVYTIMPVQEPGSCKLGIHYYYCRGFGRLLKIENFLSDEEQKIGINLLNEQVNILLNMIKEMNSDIYNKFLEIDGLKDFVENNTRLTEYK